MSNPENFEERLQIARTQIAALIAADAWVAVAPAVPVLTEEKGDIATMIAQALSKLGLCVVVVAAEGDELERSGDTLSMRVRYVVQVSEKVLLNQAACTKAGIAYRPALSCALRIMKAVDRQPNGLDVGRHLPGLNEFKLQVDRPFELLNSTTEVVYAVHFTTPIEL